MDHHASTGPSAGAPDRAGSAPGLFKQGRDPRKQRGLSLRMRLVALTVAAVMPAIAVVAYTEWNVHRLRRIEVHDLALRSARFASSEIDRIWEGLQNLLIAVAHSREVLGGDREACRSYLQQLRALSPQLTGLRVLDLNGDVRCSGSDGNGGGNLADRPYFKEALASDRMVLGRYTVGRFSGQKVLPVALALRNAEGQLVGVLAAGINLAWLGARLRERGLPPEGSVTIADPDGIIIAREPLSDQFVGTRIPDRFQRLVHANAPGTEEVTSQDGTPRILGYMPPQAQSSGLYVSAGLSAEASYRAITRATRVSAYIALAGAALALLAAWLVGNRVFRKPILTLTETLERWQSGERTVRTGYDPRRGELGMLGAALDRLMDRIEEQQEQRDLLVHELDHRVKNILATVQAIASATLRHTERTADAFPQFSERLVALSRAHDILTREKWEGADLRAVVDSIARPLDGPGGRFELEGPSVDLTPRQTLAFTMVLTELRTNAAKYGALSAEGGKVLVRWHVEDGGVLVLQWQEVGGPPVTPPSRTGFGSRLIRQGFGRDLGEVVLDYPPHGAACTIRTNVGSA